jgi:multidrug efflux pump subunit AcrA (membrane-fusion protein)
MPVVALLAVGIWWFGFHSSGTKSSAAGSIVAPQLVAVTSGTLNATVSAQGTIAALATDALSFSSSGKVTAVNVKAGDSVTAGEVLATLDSASLQASVSSAQASLAQAQAKYSDDSDAGASSQQLAADAATVTTASDALTNAHTALTGASLIADFDGVVASVNITVGQQLGSSGAGATSVSGSGSGTGNSSANVGTGTATNNQNRAGASASASSSTSSSSSSGQINITTSGVYKVDLAVSSADISKIAIGQTATLTVTTSSNSSGFGGRNQATTNTTRASATSGTTSAATAQGAVTSVGAVASASSGVATFPVTVAFKADPTQFFVGGSVIADIVTSTTGTVVMVPVRAVTTAQDGTRTVELSTDGTVNHTKTVTVTTGTTSNGMIEIRSGLQVGDKVVAAGLSASSGSGTSTGIGSFGGSGQSRTGP